MKKLITYTNTFIAIREKLLPNRWDLLALILVLGGFIALAWGARQMTAPYEIGEALPISLTPQFLPQYALRTVLRLFIALLFSLLCTFVFGTWAAKNRRAGKIILPLIDVLQSVPIIGFLSITATGFIVLFKGSLLGPECAAIFLVFTSQVWNMVLSLYQTLRTLPNDLREASAMYNLSSWQKFWRVEVPFSMPGLLWNTMMSLSGSWFYVVFSEAISVSGHDVKLPGIGSYIAVAIEQANKTAVIYAILTMFIVILIYDQLLFRPLVKWSEKFRMDDSPQEATSWVTNILQRTQIMRYIGLVTQFCFDTMVNLKVFQQKKTSQPVIKAKSYLYDVWRWVVNISFILLLILLGLLVGHYLHHLLQVGDVDWHEIFQVLQLGTYTGFRVIILIIICSFVWVPVGVWIGLRPKVARTMQPVVQMLAAFPANLFFPLFAMAIVTYHLNVEVWLTPLMVLGSQWYILFNVIAGAAMLPKNLYQAALNLGVTGFLWWKRLILPGIFPYFITGVITAAGGAWNASIAAEVINWGAIRLKATGLGAYILQNTDQGDFPRIILGIIIMTGFVLLLNYVLWRPLYLYAERRFQLD